MSVLTALWPFAAGLAIGISGLWYANRNTTFALWWYAALALLCAALSVLNADLGNWGWMSWTAALAAFSTWEWWKHWRRRKREEVRP